MMKKLLIYLSILTTILSGCTREVEDLFPESVDERLNRALQEYKSALMQAPGWKLFVYPSGLASENIEVGGLTYYVSFPDSNRTIMVSDFTVDMASVPKESGYRLKASQRPSLIFDTYSYIHVAADPDPDVSFSPTQSGGYGWGSDFDFSFTTAQPGDTLVLEGNFNHSDAYMIRASAEEMQEAFSGQLANIIEATDEFGNNNPFLFFPATDNSKIGVSFNLYLYRVNFTYLSGGDLVTLTEPFSHTTYGIHFKQPVTIGGYTFQELYWDENTQSYYLDISGNRVNITNSNEPLFPFNLVIGKSITTINIPTTPLPGQSPDLAAAYDEIEASLISGPYTLALQDMNFIFDAESKTMTLQVDVTQGGRLFLMQYGYSYTINSSNIATFTRIGANGNGSLVEGDMAPLLDHINNHSFKLDYFTDTLPVLGQFTCQSDPGFFFTGNLQ